MSTWVPKKSLPPQIPQPLPFGSIVDSTNTHICWNRLKLVPNSLNAQCRSYKRKSTDWKVIVGSDSMHQTNLFSGSLCRRIGSRKGKIQVNLGRIGPDLFRTYWLLDCSIMFLSKKRFNNNNQKPKILSLHHRHLTHNLQYLQTILQMSPLFSLSNFIYSFVFLCLGYNYRSE